MLNFDGLSVGSAGTREVMERGVNCQGLTPLFIQLRMAVLYLVNTALA